VREASDVSSKMPREMSSEVVPFLLMTELLLLVV
jgi:hypothetical protein